MARIQAITRQEPIQLYDLALQTNGVHWQSIGNTASSGVLANVWRVDPLPSGYLNNGTSTVPQYISNTFLIPGMDAIRVFKPVGSFLSGNRVTIGSVGGSGYGFNSPYPTLSFPSTYSGSTVGYGYGNQYFDYLSYSGGVGLLTSSDLALKSYKQGLTYSSSYVSIGAFSAFAGTSRTSFQARGHKLLLRSRIAPPVVSYNIGVSDRALKGTSADARLGPTGNITATYYSGMFFECFVHSDYYAAIANKPTGVNYWSATDGEFYQAGAGNQNIRLDAVQFFPPAVGSGQTKTITVTCELRNHHGYSVSRSIVITIVGASGGSFGGSNPGINSPPNRADHGLIIQAADQSIRFQSDSNDAFARKVTNQGADAGNMFNSLIGIITGNTGDPGGLRNHSAPGCNGSNAFGVTGAVTTASYNGFPLLDEVAPTLRFSSTGNLQSKGGYLKNQVTVCRVRGPSSVDNPSFGLQVTDANDNIVLDDGELSLGVMEIIDFTENTFISSGGNFGTYSYIYLPFSSYYTTPPMIAIKTAKNLFTFRPGVAGERVGIGSAAQDRYYGVSIVFPGQVRSSGQVLVMETSSTANALTYDNEEYGLQVRDQSENIVMDTRRRIATVTDLVGANQFNTGTVSPVNKFNIVGGYDGVDPNKMNDPSTDGVLPNQLVTRSINGNPGTDYICMSGVTGRTISTGTFHNQFRPCARFTPATAGTRSIDLTMGFAGQAGILPTSTADYTSHPEGSIIIIRSL
jgi:hypothetical protein